MKYILTLFLWFSCLGIMAQHNLYRWQLKGYTGMANYYNPDKSLSGYFKLDHNLWHQFEVGRSLGNTFGLSASAAFGKINGLGLQGSSFTTKNRLTAAKLFFYTDNGWLLKPTAFVSPYFFGGYGLATSINNLNDNPNESKYRQVVPFGMGLKFRLTERWQLDLQTEAIYNPKPYANPAGVEQNKFNNGFLHTGLALAYHLGFKKSNFKAARFYVSFPDTLSQVSSAPPASGNNLPKLAPRSTLLTSPADSLAHSPLLPIPDTVLVSKQHASQHIDSLHYKKVAIQQSDTTSSMNIRSRTIVRKSPLRPDTARTAAVKAMQGQGADENEFNPETRRTAPFTREETGQVRNPLRSDVENRATPRSGADLYGPSSPTYESDRNRLNRNILLLEKDRRELEAANSQNQQLRYTRESLHTAMAKDTILMKSPNQKDSLVKALDDKTLKYLQQQANLNDSIRQRLAYYENELTRLQPAPGATPVAEPLPISRFDTNVFFSLNSYQVPSQSFNELLTFANFLKANPGLKLQLTGYADQTGKPSYNQVLSRKRVEAIAAFFQSQGIAKERLLMQYFGAVKSKNGLHSLNRKVVLKTID